MRISEVRGERALDVMADLMEIFGNEKVMKAFQNNKNSEAMRILLRDNRAAVFDLISAVQDTPKGAQNLTVAAIPNELAKIFSDPDLFSLFTSEENSDTETL